MAAGPDSVSLPGRSLLAILEQPFAATLSVDFRWALPSNPR